MSICDINNLPIPKVDPPEELNDSLENVTLYIAQTTDRSYEIINSTQRSTRSLQNATGLNPDFVDMDVEMETPEGNANIIFVNNHEHENGFPSGIEGNSLVYTSPQEVENKEGEN